MSDPQRTAGERGGHPSLIRAFGIRGLYGYKTVSLRTDHAATILIAKNGSGKTTLLGALDAFLRGQFNRFRGLVFSEIFCELRDIPEPLMLSHSALNDFLEVPSDGELAKLSRQTEIDFGTLFNFLLEEYPAWKTDRRSWHENRILSAILRVTDYRTKEVIALCDRVREGLFSRTAEMSHIYESLNRALGGIEIVYLPTYRRIELALPEEKERSSARRPNSKLFTPTSGALQPADIQFGLSDISDRLSQMNQTILLQSNAGYREISANIINELVEGRIQEGTGRTIPSREELTLFFSRLQASERMGPYYPVSPPNLDRLYSNEANQGTSGQFLNYFLNKLETVIKTTHSVELQVEEFIKRCNFYLMEADASTKLKKHSPDRSVDVDAKALRLNKQDLRVHVESLASGKKVSLDALSSGEKQMVSLFGKLFLYDGEKIILIDEPELSLSMDWQRQILVDVMDAPQCRQIVAITHSPFVFDNALEPYARSLKVELDQFPDASRDDTETGLE